MTASFLALGDSYTIGEGVDERDRWPVKLVNRLGLSGIGTGNPRIVAKTGWTTDELLSAIEAERVTGTWDLVSLLAGVNDQYRGHGLEHYRRSFNPLLSRALSFAKLPSRLIVLSIPDWGVTPFADGRDRAAISHEIDSFNEAARDLVWQSGARFVDVTPASRRAASDSTLLAADGLHPSAAMYEMWVDQVQPVATAALSASF